MMRDFLLFCLLLLGIAMPALAEPRATIGTARLFTNDYLGDGRDRWRSGSYALSYLRGPGGRADPTQGFGQVMEYRLRTEIIAPARRTVAPGDRPYVGAVWVGVHSHFAQQGTLFVLGADVVTIGPQTGLSRFQTEFHERFDIPLPPFTDFQLGDATHLSLSGSATRIYRLTETATVRPFVAVEAGMEDLIRIGADVLIGQGGQGDFLLRDVVTGQLYQAGPVRDDARWRLTLGADAAWVTDSLYLPADQGFAPRDLRLRARAGVQARIAPGTALFYGLTWLGPEFDGQQGGQVVGSLQLKMTF